MQGKTLKRFLLSLGAITFGLSSITALGYVPPSHKIALTAPKKPLVFKNWGLVNSQGSSHIHALDAWKIEEGSHKVIVAVIDTGIDPTHKDLNKNIWRDPKATPTGSQPYGWDFVTGRANPMDEHGHGTHVAGIIGAWLNPEAGISGVARKVSIMAVRYYSDTSSGATNLANTIRAIHYAIDHGARIINYSGGGPEFSQEEYNAIKRAEQKGILFVAAAGNERQNTDLTENKYYPSAYRLSNIISVAATDIRNNLLASSNWGKTKVDVAAPGQDIYSTLPGGRYGTMSGTSQATAFVSGLASLLLSQDPTLTPVELKALIMSSVDRFPQLQDKLITGGRVNAHSALLALKARGKADLPHLAQKKTPAELVARRPVSLMNAIVETP